MKSFLLGGAVAAALIGLAGAASAATPDNRLASQSCFRTTDWQGWHAPNDKTLYLRVRMHDIYRLDLNFSSSMLTWPDSHLVNVVHGPDIVCSPIDLQLSVAQGTGIGRDFLMIKTITKLTPEEIAAIPKKDLP